MRTTMQTLTSKFYIDEWLIDPRLNRVTGRGRTVLIEPKVMQVLACLAAEPGDVVDREALLDQVWGDTVVTDHVLTRSISELRKVFGDDARQPSVIETIPKTGYRLIAPVIIADPAPASDGEWHRYPGDSTPQQAGDITITASVPAWSSPEPEGFVFRGRVAALAGLLVLALVVSAWLLIPSASAPITPLPTQPFTSLPGMELFPAFHGQNLAFTWSGPDSRTADLYVKLIGEETTLQLTDDSANVMAPAWSPDGHHLAFRRYAKDHCGVFLISALGGPERKLVDCATSEFGLAWSPDGAWLAVARHDTARQNIGFSLLSLETRELRPLTRPDQPHQRDHTATFSPDGHWLAFLRSVSYDMADVYVVPVEGRAAPTRLTFDNRHVAGLAWAADGRSLVFSSNREGNFKLWRIPASGGEPEWLAAVGAYDPGGLAVAAEGDYLAYEEWDYEINVWGIALAASDAPSRPKRFVASTRWDYHPQISPDGQRLAFASNRSGHFELWTCDFDGANPMRLTSFNGPFVGMPRWSPDGRKIVFDARADGRAALYLIDADGGPPTRLTNDPSDHLAPSWSRDGQWIYFASNRSSAWQIWKMPAAGGAATQVTRDGGYLAFESMDGDVLYFSKYGTPGLWRISTEGGAETHLLDDLTISDWGNWTVGEAGIYYVGRAGTTPTLNLFDPATREVKLLRRFDGPALSHEPGLTLSPDGTWLLYARADRVESDIVLVEQFR